jgi:hypothetical protein
MKWVIYLPDDRSFSVKAECLVVDEKTATVTFKDKHLETVAVLVDASGALIIRDEWQR